MLTAGATLVAIAVRFTTTVPVPTSPTLKIQVHTETTGIVFLATASHNEVRVWQAMPGATGIYAFG
jgi:hypothetical protein